jgi:hypothetical protein
MFIGAVIYALYGVFAEPGSSPSEANALAAAIALGLTYDWRLDLTHFPYAAE